jgi:ribosome-associated heat shock protein Hsp15
VNREKVIKPATEVGEGDTITIALHGRVRVLKVLGFSSRRGPAPEAGLLYEDLSAAQKQVPKG